MIYWEPLTSDKKKGVCPVCNSQVYYKTVLHINNHFALNNKLKFVRCDDCKCLWVNEGKLFEYTDHNAIKEEHLSHYLHVGAGIDSMVRPIERLRSNVNKSLLDVGCGYGFTLDYWQTTKGGDSFGVEPSSYGVMGRDHLKLNIVNQYLTNALKTKERKYDIIFSSEVIEHVDKPTDFLLEIKKIMSESGTLVLTTPNAEYIQQDKDPSVLLAVLSPGLHKFLFSKEKLERILSEIPFKKVKVEIHNERLVAFASNTILQLNNAENGLNQYISYLETRLKSKNLPFDLRIGLAFRAFKELVNKGEYSKAVKYKNLYCSLVEKKYLFKSVSGEEDYIQAKKSKSFDDYSNYLPYCHGVFLFYLGILLRNHEHNIKKAINTFENARNILNLSVKLAPIFFQEAATLVVLAEYERGSALHSFGERETAIKCLKNLLAPNNEYSYLKLSIDLNNRITEKLKEIQKTN